MWRHYNAGAGRCPAWPTPTQGSRKMYVLDGQVTRTAGGSPLPMARDLYVIQTVKMVYSCQGGGKLIPCPGSETRRGP